MPTKAISTKVTSTKVTPSKSSRSRRPFRVGRSKTGFGLFATRVIERGEFIAYYLGRKIPNKIADELETKYLFELNSRYTIDGSTRRNLARYMNHSCRPNADADSRKDKIVIAATRTIQPGDEITSNYGRSYFNTFIKPVGCKCLACDSHQMVVRSARKKGRGRRTRTKAKSKTKA
jgi:SET domain-containing protein